MTTTTAPPGELADFAAFPEGLNPVGVRAALGPALVETCWDGLQEAYHLYVTDAAAVDREALAPHLGSARMEMVVVDHVRPQFEDWEVLAQEALRRFMITASANVTVVVPGWPAGDRFCSPTGPYLKVEVHDETPDAVVADALASLPSELVLVVRQEPSQFLSGG